MRFPASAADIAGQRDRSADAQVAGRREVGVRDDCLERVEDRVAREPADLDEDPRIVKRGSKVSPSGEPARIATSRA